MKILSDMEYGNEKFRQHSLGNCRWNYIFYIYGGVYINRGIIMKQYFQHVFASFCSVLLYILLTSFITTDLSSFQDFINRSGIKYSTNKSIYHHLTPEQYEYYEGGQKYTGIIIYHFQDDVKFSFDNDGNLVCIETFPNIVKLPWPNPDPHIKE